MAQKKDSNFILPDDYGNSFEDEDEILNYRPQIRYIEPPQESFPLQEERDAADSLTIDSFRDRTQKLINGLRAASELADKIQQRVNDRVINAGGISVTLDPTRDGHVIAAIKRVFPDKKDFNSITFDDYSRALDCMRSQASGPVLTSAVEMRWAKTDPYRTSFGGSENKRGENRPELSSDFNVIKPTDLNAFQKAGVIALFGLMRPLIKREDKIEIMKHNSAPGKHNY